MKPLFIPLKRCYFEQFEQGAKRFEYRGYGRTWTEKHCIVNRPVTLSLGYSGRRLQGKITSFKKISLEHAPFEAKEIYGNRYEWIAKIEITLCNEKNTF